MNEESSNISVQTKPATQKETQEEAEILCPNTTVLPNEENVAFGNTEAEESIAPTENETLQTQTQVQPANAETEAEAEIYPAQAAASSEKENAAPEDAQVNAPLTKTKSTTSPAKEKSSKSKSKSKSKTKLRRPKTKPSPSEPIVIVKDVSVIFNIANEKIQSLKEYFIKMTKRELMFRKFVAVDDVSFQVNKGDVFGLVGTNGSGKSTLLKVVAGVLEPTMGTCTVNGSISPLIELGAGFDMELTARENIYLNGALLGLSKKYIDEQIDEIIEFAELHDFMEMPLKNYSSGMVARIAFAIATTTEPDLLIVDEVLSVGDFLFQEKCEKRIAKMIKHGTTVLIVSHNIKQIDRLCTRVMWIEKSQMRMIGKAKEVCKAYKHFEGYDQEE